MLPAKCVKVSDSCYLVPHGLMMRHPSMSGYIQTFPAFMLSSSVDGNHGNTRSMPLSSAIEIISMRAKRWYLSICSISLVLRAFRSTWVDTPPGNCSLLVLECSSQLTARCSSSLLSSSSLGVSIFLLLLGRSGSRLLFSARNRSQIIEACLASKEVETSEERLPN